MPGGQRGFALLALVAIVTVGLAYALVTGLAAWGMQLDREGRTDEALALAKDALIGRAAADGNHPGSLPCPDTDDDGSAEIFAGADCPSYIGRLPWRTLGLPDLRDGNGERLWYALSGNFRDYTTNVINSDTLGTLVVYAADGATALTLPGYQAVAVLFSAGAPLSGQDRDAASALCATTGTTLQRRLCATNYLESASGRNNATPGGPYIAGAPSDTFNDRLLFITTRELMPLVERRVAGELIKALNSFYSTFGFYPWADSNVYVWGDPSYGDEADLGLNKGKLPWNIDYDSSQEAQWQGSLPVWFEDNRWYDVILYAVGRDVTYQPWTCSWPSCSLSLLQVNDGATIYNSVHVAFFMPGTPAAGVVRPSVNWMDYVQDAENHDNDTDGDGDPNNDVYVAPSAQALDRDRIHFRDSSLTWRSR